MVLQVPSNNANSAGHSLIAITLHAQTQIKPRTRTSQTVYCIPVKSFAAGPIWTVSHLITSWPLQSTTENYLVLLLCPPHSSSMHCLYLHDETDSQITVSLLFMVWLLLDCLYQHNKNDSTHQTTCRMPLQSNKEIHLCWPASKNKVMDHVVDQSTHLMIWQ